MEVTLAVTADYASVSDDGKLNIMGVFQHINPPVLPFPLPQMFLVVVMEASVAEQDTQKALEILLLDDDGNRIVELSAGVVIPPMAPGQRSIYTNSVIGFGGLEFHESGNYAFHILVNGEEKRTVPLQVNEPPAAIGGSDG